MRVHARRCDPKVGGDLLRRSPRRDGAQDLALAVGQCLFDRPAIKDAPGKQIPGEDTENKRRRALPVHREGERPRLAARASARALQRAPLRRANYLVLETLEEQLAAAARAERLVAVIPDRCVTAPDVGVSRTKLLDRGPAGIGGHDDLAQAVAAEIAVKLGSKSHERVTST